MPTVLVNLTAECCPRVTGGATAFRFVLTPSFCGSRRA